MFTMLVFDSCFRLCFGFLDLDLKFSFTKGKDVLIGLCTRISLKLSVGRLSRSLR